MSYIPDHSFTAFDVETATGDPRSICQIGIIRGENGIIVSQIERLVQPPNNFYNARNIEIHGIMPSETVDSVGFDVVWKDIEHLFQDQVVVAHNVGFDVNCLRSTLAHYGIEQPHFEERCTRRIYGRGLKYLSKKYKIPLNHHNALSDAHCCAQLYLKYQARMSLPKTGSLF